MNVVTQLSQSEHSRLITELSNTEKKLDTVLFGRDKYGNYCDDSDPANVENSNGMLKPAVVAGGVAAGVGAGLYARAAYNAPNAPSVAGPMGRINTGAQLIGGDIKRGVSYIGSKAAGTGAHAAAGGSLLLNRLRKLLKKKV